MQFRLKTAGDLKKYENHLKRDLSKYAKYMTVFTMSGPKQRLLNNGSFSYRKTKHKSQP